MRCTQPARRHQQCGRGGREGAGPGRGIQGVPSAACAAQHTELLTSATLRVMLMPVAGFLLRAAQKVGAYCVPLALAPAQDEGRRGGGVFRSGKGIPLQP